MTYKILLYNRADRDLDTLNDGGDLRDDITEEISELADHRNPLTHRNVTKLDCGDHIYRLRIGDYRVIFGVDSPNLIVFRVTERTDRTYNKENMEHLESLWKRAQRTAV